MPPSTSNFTRTLGILVGDAVNICVSQGSAGIAYGVQLSVVEDGFSRDRVYRAEVKTSGNPEGWRRLVSLDKTESGTTWALDVLVSGASATFRLVRSGSSAGSTVLKCKVLAYSGAGGSVTITGSSATSQGVTNVGTYEGALLTKVDGKVGIGTDVPGETLDVVGSLRVSGNTLLKGLGKSTTGNALYIDAATGLLTYGQIVANGVDAGNVYTRAELDAGQLDSRYYTETEVNSLLDTKANVANASLTGTTTTGQLTANALTVLGNVALKSLASQQTGNALYIDAATGQLSYGEIVSDGIDAGNVYTRTQLDAGQLDSRYYTEAEVNSLLGSKENVITASTTSAYFRGDKTFQTLNTTAVPEGSNLYFTEARAQSALVTQLSAKENTIPASTTATYFRGDKTFQTLNTSAVAESASNLYFTNARAQSAVVSQTITDGVTTTAPSENAVFDALALKENTITASTTAAYFRGDKTFQTLNTAAVSESASNLYFTEARAQSALVTQLSAKENTIPASTTATYFRGDKTFQTLNTSAVAESASNLYFTNARAQTAVVSQTITDGVTTTAPSENAVFDALALKENTITASTTSAYFRGDKTFQTLNTAAVSESASNLYFTNARAQAALVTQLSAKENTIAASTTATYFRGDKTFQTLNTSAVAESASNLYFTNARAQTAVVSQTITDGVTTTAPSENAVFDALALKENTITASTTAAYFRGDKTFQTLNTTAVPEGSNLYFTEARAQSALVTQLSAKENTIPASTTATYFRGDKTFQTLNTSAVAESASNLYFTNARAQSAVVSQTITDGVTTTAPSENAVFDALALKENTITASTTAAYFRGDKTFQTLNTAAVAESASNLYFTNARAQAALVTQLSAKENTIAASTTATYFRGDKSFQTLNTAAVPESASNLYFTDARAQSALITQLNAKENTIAASTTATYFRGDKSFQTLNTAAVPESLSNLYFTNTRAQSAVVSQTITDGVTTTAPSENAVFDALTLKANVANTILTGNTVTDNLTASALTLNNTAWASYVVHSTSTPFTYTGPGSSLANGVPFFSQTEANGTAFVTPSGNNNTVFTFATSGVYLLQSEVDAGFPYFPEADLYTYYIKNGNTASQFAKETHSPTSFSCTRPYLFTASANDNVRFIMESFAGNEYEVGLNSTRFTMLKLA